MVPWRFPCLMVMLLWLSAWVEGAELPTIRVATYNASLNRSASGQLQADLATPGNTQARRAAEVIQRVAPDILVLNEFDFDPGGVALTRFHDNYLAVSQNGQAALNYPYRFAPPSNTGVSPGTVHGAGYAWDFDNANGKVISPGTDAYGNDCFGFGQFPGQYGLAIYSKFPIDTAAARTFQKFLWKDLPDPVWPDHPSTPAEAGDWYTAAEKSIFRLSSKTHADVPVTVAPGLTVHLLASHPTPPSFDGSEDRNGRRNREEIRFWSHFVDNAPFLYDDATTPRSGGLPTGERFVILGDLNADPHDGDSYQQAILQLYTHPRVQASHNPSSAGAVQDAQSEGGINTSHLGNAAYDTADFGSPGNLRVDHVLPSVPGLTVLQSGVFWPRSGEPGFASAVNASDHRLVWVDLRPDPAKDLRVDAESPMLVFRWQGARHTQYRLEHSDTLLDWQAANALVSIDEANFTVEATLLPEDPPKPATRYFRVASTPAP